MSSDGLSLLLYRQQMISQYEELLNNCDVAVDTDYPIAISKVFSLSPAHLKMMT